MSCTPTQTASTLRRAKNLNLHLEQGAQFMIPIVYKEGDDVFDFTGATVKCQFREKVSSVTPVIDLELGNGLELTPLEGKIVMTITAQQTAAMAIFKGVWDMLITLPSGEKFRILTGEWEVSRGVTR